MKLGYKEMVIDYLDHSLGAFGSEYSHDISREMVCDDLQIHRNRFAEFIEDDFDHYNDQLKNWEHGVEN